jgi:hypothetical protein
MKRKGLKKIVTRHKLWKLMGLGDLPKNWFWKNKHRTCGCSMCRGTAFFKKYTKRQNRRKSKLKVRQKAIESF